jgi:hypothetical protein
MDLTNGSDVPETASTGGVIERLAAHLPEDVLLWTGLGAAAASLGLAIAGKSKMALSLLGWVPALLTFEMYAKVARSAAARSYRPDLH